MIRPTSPSFLCIGAQKSGTTTLHRLLSSHPGIFMPTEKELHYFSLHYHCGPGWYAEHFRGARPWQICGEITPYYLFHPQVPSRIRALLPEARLIVLLRDPVERALSGFFHSSRLGQESLPLEQALAAEQARLQDADHHLKQPGSRHVSHQCHSYVSRSRYELQLSRFLRLFPADQMLILRCEDLLSSGEKAWRQILEFIGASYKPLPRRLPHANRGRGEASVVPAHVRAMLHSRLALTYEAMARDYGLHW
ncbi:MAG: sulfotransferase [Cyanobacteriota bacterium]|nr:sulfotransferase [Cyanobacteriota bacterium]